MKKMILILSVAGTAFSDIFYSACADVLDNWTTNQISTNSFALTHVVYGNGIYVATAEFGDGGVICSSVDGFNWTQRFSDNNSWGLTLNYSSGHFAGVGGFGIADVSADGTNWISTFLPNGFFDPGSEKGNAITYGNGLYVTVGDTNGVGNILTSPDGVTWTSRSITNGAGGRITSVASGVRRFVAIGNNDGFVYTSSGFSAGVNWAKNSLLGGSKVSYANGLFIVPLNNKTNLISVDGINWSPQFTRLTNMLGAVTYGNGLFMAQCGISTTGSYLATSTNGTNWVQYAQRLPNLLELFDIGDPDISLATDGTRLVTIGETNAGYPLTFYSSFVYTSDVLVGVRMTNNLPAQVALSGLVGRSYQIQSADTLPAGVNNWQTKVTLQLPNTPYIWTDVTATNSARFYRGVLMP